MSNPHIGSTLDTFHMARTGEIRAVPVITDNMTTSEAKRLHAHAMTDAAASRPAPSEPAADKLEAQSNV